MKAFWGQKSNVVESSPILRCRSFDPRYRSGKICLRRNARNFCKRRTSVLNFVSFCTSRRGLQSGAIEKRRRDSKSQVLTRSLDRYVALSKQWKHAKIAASILISGFVALLNWFLKGRINEQWFDISLEANLTASISRTRSSVILQRRTISEQGHIMKFEKSASDCRQNESISLSPSYFNHGFKRRYRLGGCKNIARLESCSSKSWNRSDVCLSKHLGTFWGLWESRPRDALSFEWIRASDSNLYATGTA